MIDAAARPNLWRIVRWTLPVLLLLVPLVAMRFTDEVQWTGSDFVVMGVLLFGAVGAYELLTRASSSLAYRAGAAVAVLASFLLVWINLAVGIIGTEDNGANLLYLAVLAAAVLGAALGRFRPAGLMWAMVAAALVQAGIGAAAVASGWGVGDPNWPLDTIGVTALFGMLWLLAAALFRMAALGASRSASTP